jgi:hypothetical protein
MLTLEGRVLSVINHEARTGRDGKAYEGYSQVQLQVEEVLENGQVRYGIQTMTTATPERFEKHTGEMIAVPVRAYIRGGSVAFTMQANAEPSAVRNPEQQLRAVVA